MKIYPPGQKYDPASLLLIFLTATASMAIRSFELCRLFGMSSILNHSTRVKSFYLYSRPQLRQVDRSSRFYGIIGKMYVHSESLRAEVGPGPGGRGMSCRSCCHHHRRHDATAVGGGGGERASAAGHVLPRLPPAKTALPGRRRCRPAATCSGRRR
jgi:hypothetical protein